MSKLTCCPVDLNQNVAVVIEELAGEKQILVDLGGYQPLIAYRLPESEWSSHRWQTELL